MQGSSASNLWARHSEVDPNASGFASSICDTVALQASGDIETDYDRAPCLSST